MSKEEKNKGSIWDNFSKELTGGYDIKPTEGFTEEFSKIIKNKMDKDNQEALQQLVKYCYIFKKNKLTNHWEVNNIISTYKLWDQFKEIRSKNLHEGTMRAVNGIKPYYFKLVCEILNVGPGEGGILIKSEDY